MSFLENLRKQESIDHIVFSYKNENIIMYDCILLFIFRIYLQAVGQSINVVIPHQVNAIYESIKDIINGFSKILKNPKEALGNIGKGVFTYETDFVFLGSSRFDYGKI